MSAWASITGKQHVAAQIALAVLLSAALTYAVIWLNYRTVLNVLWMIALPLVLGWLWNQGARRRAFMAMALTCVSLLTVMAVGWAMGGI